MASTTATSTTHPTDVPAQRAAVPAADFDAVDSYVREQMRKARIPGLVLAVVRGGGTVHLEGFGRADSSGRPFTPQTPFFIGSNSKSFTALAVMQLVEAGKVELDAPVRRYIPWFRVADPEASRRITVRNLLNQTSGLGEGAGREEVLDPALEKLESAVRAMATVVPDRPVGEQAEYSNLNYTTLGLVVEKVSGESFDDYLLHHVLEPLEMHHTYVSLDEAEPDGPASGYRYWFGVPVPFENAPRGTVPTGGIISTAEDMSHYLEMYLNGGRYRDSVLLSPEGIAEMLRPAARMVGGFEAGTSYGMGWMWGPWGGVEASYHFGDWAHAHAGMSLDAIGGWAVFVMFNIGLHGGAFPGLLEVEQGVLALLTGGQPKDTGIDRLYLALDSAVAGALAAELWSFVRLARRRDEALPDGSPSTAGPGALPLLWEVGIPVAIAVVPPRMFKVGWKGLRLYGPDLSYALTAIGGVFVAKAALRAAKMARRLRPRGCAGAST